MAETEETEEKKPPRRYIWKKFQRIPVLSIILAELLLISLGVWQVQRMQEKEQMLAEAQSAMDAGILTELPDDPEEYDEMEYRRISLSGRYYYPQTLHRVGKKSSGYYLLTPLQLEGGRVILVNRGWAPKGRLGILDDAGGLVEGFLRKPLGSRLFSPDNEVEKNIWFTEEIDAMSQQTGFELEPMILEATGPQNASGIPVIARGDFKANNNHLGYAITWFLLALIAPVMFVLWHRVRISEEQYQKMQKNKLLEQKEEEEEERRRREEEEAEAAENGEDEGS